MLEVGLGKYKKWIWPIYKAIYKKTAYVFLRLYLAGNTGTTAVILGFSRVINCIGQSATFRHAPPLPLALWWRTHHKKFNYFSKTAALVALVPIISAAVECIFCQVKFIIETVGEKEWIRGDTGTGTGSAFDGTC